MNKEREIVVVLHDGTKVSMNTEERVVFHCVKPGLCITSEPDAIFDDVLITLEQREAEVEKLKKALEISEQINKESREEKQMKSKMSLMNAFSILMDNAEQLERIKKQLYVAAMNNHSTEVDRLRPIIRTYEHDIEVFEQQIIEFDMIQSSSPKEGQ